MFASEVITGCMHLLGNNKKYMFHIRTLRYIYTCVVNQQVHTDKVCFYTR